jgi:hypothetical protein
MPSVAGCAVWWEGQAAQGAANAATAIASVVCTAFVCLQLVSVIQTFSMTRAWLSFNPSFRGRPSGVGRVGICAHSLSNAYSLFQQRGPLLFFFAHEREGND